MVRGIQIFIPENFLVTYVFIRMLLNYILGEERLKFFITLDGPWNSVKRANN
jgi:hypothetical protein